MALVMLTRQIINLYLLRKKHKSHRFNIREIFIKSQLIHTHMDQNYIQGPKDHFQSQEWDRQTGFFKTQRLNSQFQKNYPKNIFIPIIEYLADIGFQNQYEGSVGTREEFEGKNVVSLSLIHKLLSQQWFQRHVNKSLLEANISNKILMNSKIKKKLFHLKVARILLETEAHDAKEFKKLVSRKANSVALEIQENDEIFDHPSSVIYLLTLFLNILKSFTSSKAETFKFFSDSQLSQRSNSSRGQQHNSKQEFKNLTKNIIIAFSKIKASPSVLNELKLKIHETILQRALEINHKFDLINGSPNWEDFLEVVVNRCIEYKIGTVKMTNSLLNQWILEFKQKSSQYGVQKPCEMKPQPYFVSKDFKPIILVMPPMISPTNIQN